MSLIRRQAANSRYRRTVLALAAFAAIQFGAVANAAPAHADTPAPADALALVQTVVDDGTSAISSARTSRLSNAGAFMEIFQDSFATTLIGKKLLGTYWESISPAEQDQFISAFGGYLADELVAKFPTGSFTIFEAVDSRSDTTAGSVSVVKTVFAAENSSSAVEWHLADIAGQPKVVDIVLSGKSVMTEKHGEYTNFLGENDGSILALIAFLAD